MSERNDSLDGEIPIVGGAASGSRILVDTARGRLVIVYLDGSKDEYRLNETFEGTDRHLEWTAVSG